MQAITNVFAHRELWPFYAVLVVATLSFSFGWFFAFGDSEHAWRSIPDALMNIIFLQLLGENVPESEEGNSEIFVFLLMLAVFTVSLVLVNIFIAVVSEVFATAQSQAERHWQDELERDYLDQLGRKGEAQGVYFCAPSFLKNCSREVSEVDDDVKPTTQADVYQILDMLTDIGHTMSSTGTPMVVTATSAGDAEEHAKKLVEVVARVVGEQREEHARHRAPHGHCVHQRQPRVPSTPAPP